MNSTAASAGDTVAVDGQFKLQIGPVVDDNVLGDGHTSDIRLDIYDHKRKTKKIVEGRQSPANPARGPD